jgi:hypothetical protein
MKKFARYIGALLFCSFYRVLRIFPNNDPIMGFALPFAKRDKWWQAALFAVIAMVSFDFLTMKLGPWTIGTALAYGFIALLFSRYFRRQKSVGLKKYAGSSIVGVLIFDFITGPVMSSFLFRVHFWAAFLGQIPFTLMHLAGAVPLTLLIVPIADPALRKSLQKSLAENAQSFRLIFSRINRL